MFFLFFFSILLYFLPTIIGRHKADAMGIFLVNLLFGWTVIGWMIALIWACAAERYVPVRLVPVSSGRFCSQCGTLSPYGAHYCAACGRTV
jgi:Superinfection immunity protein